MGKWRTLAAVLLVAAVAGCGGGGGSPGTTTGNSGGGGSTSGGGSGGGTSGGGTTASAPKLSVGLYNTANSATSSIALGGGYVARATLLDAKGAPVTDKLVTFSLSGAPIAALTPSTALTNSSGIAEVAIAPASVSAIGAATLSASADLSGTAVTGDKDFSVSATSLSLSGISATSSSLASGGNTSLTVSALVGGSPATGVPVNVTFSASCGKINGTAGSFSVTTNGSGVAQADYSAVAADGSLCSGSVTITASTAGATPVTRILTVAAPTAKSLAFVKADSPQIFVAGSGAVEQTLVRFKVYSAAGTPMSGQSVDFTVSPNPLGVTWSPASGLTDSTGEVSVLVSSSTLPGPVKMRASLSADASVFAETQNLTIASGPPSQRFMSLSVSTFNIEGETVDGSSTTLTARVADRQGNAVEDGTVVNFTTEGGQVAYSCATQRANNISSCNVTFESQNPRPSDGRVTVLAFTSGTKDYVDNNGNNRYDAGDRLVDIGDAYRDDNENGAFDAGEFVITRGGSATCTGSGGSYPGRVNTCDGALATTVRQETVLLFSSSESLAPDVSAKTLSNVTFQLRSKEHPLLPMPAGTTLSAEGIGASCAVRKLTPSTVPNVTPGFNPAADLATVHDIFLAGCVAGDSVLLTVTSPRGVARTFSIGL